MEAALCAVQEQALATNNVRHKIYKQKYSPLCRSCLKHNETITHVVSGCPKISKKKYTPWHNGIAKYLHWRLLRDQSRNVPDQWHLQETPTKKVGKVVEFKDGVEVLWDKTVKVDWAVEANRPGI
eukprot:5430686-Ditylum_brightwellii.AAC.1